MSRCAKVSKQFTDAYYGELGVAGYAAFRAHLARCESCAAEYETIRSVLEETSRYERPEPGEEFWECYWEKLEGRLDERERRRVPLPGRLRIFFPEPSWASWRTWRPLLAGAALLVAGMFIGRTYLADSPDESVVGRYAEVTGTEMALVNQRAADYFGRSRLLLLGFVNCDTDPETLPADYFARQASLSRSLLEEAGELREELEARRRYRLIELMGELEAVLTQIANLDSETGRVEIELIQYGARRKALLFKIDIGEQLIAEEDTNTGQSGPATENVADRKRSLL